MLKYIAPIRFIKGATQPGILLVVGLLFGQANALEQLHDGDATREISKLSNGINPVLISVAGQQSMSASENSKPGSVLLLPVEQNGTYRNNRIFGELSLLLSTSLSVTVSEPALSANSVKGNNDYRQERTSNKAKLSELNAKIAVIESVIKERERKLNVAHSEITLSNDQSLSTFLVLDGGGADVLAVNPDAADLSGVVYWIIAWMVLLLAAIGLTWHYRRMLSLLLKGGLNRGVVDTLYQEPIMNKSQEADIKEYSMIESVSRTALEVDEKDRGYHSQSTNMHSMLPPEYEMLEEADIYLRFGHEKLAEEVLRELIILNPNYPQTYLMLLRILCAREDSSSFLDVAKQLKTLGDQGIWQSAAEMGRSLDSKNTFYH